MLKIDRFYGVPESRNSGVYMLYNHDNHKAYISQTKDFRSRALRHKSGLSQGKHYCKELQNDYEKGHKISFVVLDDMGPRYKRRETLTAEKRYQLAFMDKYVHLYNHETVKQIRDALFYESVMPPIYEIQKNISGKFGIPLASLERCKSKHLFEIFGESKQPNHTEEG